MTAPLASSFLHTTTTFAKVKVPFTKKLYRTVNLLLEFDEIDYILEDFCVGAFGMAQMCLAAHLEGYLPVMRFPNGRFREILLPTPKVGRVKAEALVDCEVPPLVYAELVADKTGPVNMAYGVMQWFLPCAQEMGLRGAKPRFYVPAKHRHAGDPELLSIEKQRAIEKSYEKKAG